MLLAAQCRKCRQTLRRLMLLAMIEDAGAKLYPSADECPNGGEHDFADEPGYCEHCGDGPTCIVCGRGMPQEAEHAAK